MSVLEGVRIVEFEGLGPGPFCGMLLADLGADVILIERKGSADAGAIRTRPIVLCDSSGYSDGIPVSSFDSGDGQP